MDTLVEQELTELAESLSDFRVENANLKERIGQLEEMLNRLEWCDRDEFCPTCHYRRPNFGYIGHYPECELRALLHG